VLVWGVQMALNASWSYMMFGRKDIAMALVDIAILWLAIIAFIALTFKPVPKASGLFVPYALWVSFAAALNFAVWQLNA